MDALHGLVRVQPPVRLLWPSRSLPPSPPRATALPRVRPAATVPSPYPPMRAPLLACLTLLAAVTAPAATAAKLRVLILDGQNNHTVWPKSTAMMRTRSLAGVAAGAVTAARRVRQARSRARIGG